MDSMVASFSVGFLGVQYIDRCEAEPRERGESSKKVEPSNALLVFESLAYGFVKSYFELGVGYVDWVIREREISVEAGCYCYSEWVVFVVFHG